MIIFTHRDTEVHGRERHSSAITLDSEIWYIKFKASTYLQLDCTLSERDLTSVHQMQPFRLLSLGLPVYTLPVLVPGALVRKPLPVTIIYRPIIFKFGFNPLWPHYTFCW